MADIDCVLFDLDDTLHDDTFAYKSAAEEVAREVAALHGVDAIALKAAYVAEAEGFWTQLSSDQLATRLSRLRARLWNNALGAVGLDDETLAERSAANYNLYRKKHLTLFPGARDLLQRLRAGGKKLGLVTNGFAETHREKIAILRVGDLFDAIFIADEVGMLKPDPLLFAHACTKLECAPAHSAMIGDRYERDIRGAHEAGLYTIWMNVHEAQLPSNAPPPDATVRTLDEVARVLLAEPA
ncbi:MAG TPA: HAD family hydrolase [Candidatus Baltobacteraceae bacterium]|jgi:HAD superfamily hydrolase (TIGR01549 family)